MENKKYEGLDSSFYEESKPTLLERITGARRIICGVALTAALVSSVPIGLEVSCHRNDPTMFICPITQIQTKLFGYEAGLRHQAQDLEGYSKVLENIDDGVTHEVSATNVEYVDGETRYFAPTGGTLTQDESGEMVVIQTVAATATTYVAPDGSKQTIYTVPSGFVLQGNVGVRKVPAIALDQNDSVQFEYNFLEDGEITSTYDQSWIYQDGEYVLKREYKGRAR